MNKSLKSTALCTMLLFTSIFPHIQLLDQDSIDKKAVAIETMITRERYMLAAFTLMGVAQNIVYLLPLYHWFTGKSQSVAADLVDAKPSPQFSWSEKFSNFGNATKNLLFTQEGWFSIANTGFYLGGQMSILFIMNKIAHDLQHPDTITWYVSAKIPYKRTINVMRDSIQRVRRSPSPEQLDFDKLSLKNMSIQLAGYGESICAYMQYKSSSSALSSTQRHMAQASSRYLFNYHNQWLKEVGALLESEASSYYKVEQLITSYELELAHQIKLFSSVESEVVL